MSVIAVNDHEIITVQSICLIQQTHFHRSLHDIQKFHFRMNMRELIDILCKESDLVVFILHGPVSSRNQNSNFELFIFYHTAIIFK